eukprot:Gregarina_sp_Poly_1__2203@NODE_1587_length_3776_cov_106_342410_g1048_i0_p1_GENE_NODE_1587_length_3776_cov_106_342410_g1048_i0NODE_1587_length_3776_cov_106_342410_g1048_i0_p1_ORF_typecomplete_len397_score55_55ArfGap/PF01412_18/2e24_NODE_1587_length_3776_cov_106_342410_g1048_i0281191
MSGANATLPKALALECDERGFVAEGPRDKAFLTLRGLGYNRLCFECGARNAPWISTTFAVFLCVNCSGNHRNLGARVSFVRSTELDKTKLEEILRLEIGGNARAKHFFRSHGFVEAVDYRSKPAERYRRTLDKEVQELISIHRPELLKESSKSVPDFLNSVDGGGAEPARMQPSGAPVNSLDSPRVVEEESPAPPVHQEPLVKPREPQLILPASKIAPSQLHFSTSSKPTLKARTEDFDFDFETAFMTGASSTKDRPSSPSKPYATSSPGHSVAQASVSPTLINVPKDLAQARSLSNVDFSGDAKPTISAADFQRFRNATAISSDAFFNADANPENFMAFEDSASAKLSIYSDKAVQKASNLAAAAQESLRSAANWFSRVSSTPPSL